jgi:predicted type IV restriction endonuclease
MGNTPDTVKRLVDRFDQNRDAYLSGSYNEAQLRHEFLGPFFTALGWDVSGRRDCDPSHRQVVGGRQLSSSLSST